MKIATVKEVEASAKGLIVVGKIAKIFDGDIRLWQLYEIMKELGNWDIVIPHIQEN